VALNIACEQFTDEARIAAFDCACQLDVVRDLIGDDGINDIIDAASDAVAMATGLRVTGRCTVTVRPCSDGVCGCTWRCHCCDIDGVKLPGVDITIDSVKIDGVTEDPALYHLVDRNILVRWGAASGQSWPGIQSLTKPDTEEGTFAITYSHGRLPWVAMMSATEIACDLMTGIDPGGQMKLPKAAVSAIMDGTTINLDPQQLGLFPWMERLFGLYPQGPQPVIWSPEVRGHYSLHTVA
jgi:hypothetical protein